MTGWPQEGNDSVEHLVFLNLRLHVLLPLTRTLFTGQVKSSVTESFTTSSSPQLHAEGPVPTPGPSPPSVVGNHTQATAPAEPQRRLWS